MKTTDIKKQFSKIKWTTEHTLTPDQVKKLIQNKLERAEKMHQSRVESNKRLLGT